MTAPLVSVAMKSYDHAPYVEQAVRSVLAQSLDDFELLVTDDGSSDATPDIVASIRDARIGLLRSPVNRGPATAMNMTVRRARGEFVAILNSDDFMLPGRLERQVAYLRANPDVAAVFSVPVQVDESGAPAVGFGSLFAIPFDHALPNRAEWLRRFFFEGNCLCAPSAMVRRAALERIGPDDPRLMLLLDLDRWIRLLARFELHVVDEPQTAFRVHVGLRNLSAGTPATLARAPFESFEVFRRYRRFAPELLREIFAPEIARLGLDASRPAGIWLAEAALTGRQTWHPFFALDTLFDAAADERDYRRIRELSGTVNAFSAAATRAGSG
jgi:glycosyltransferase involved in cell wall biosynthesis